MNASLDISIYHPILIEVAKKFSKSSQDAEDAVQDTLLKWLSIDQDKVANKKAYLIQSVKNNCLNRLNSFNEKKKEYIETWKSFEFVEDEDFADFDIDTEIEEALTQLHKKLEPIEKAIFLMREVFNVEYEELTQLFNKKKENCRKIVSRAKEKLNLNITKLKIDMPDHSSLVESFRKACSLDDPKEIIKNMMDEIEHRKRCANTSTVE